MNGKEYDPEYWSDQMNAVIGQYSGQRGTAELGRRLDEELKPLRDGQSAAAHAAFPLSRDMVGGQ
jgi:hypothetical protein